MLFMMNMKCRRVPGDEMGGAGLHRSGHTASQCGHLIVVFGGESFLFSLSVFFFSSVSL
jgi:hypothetical protein